MKKIFLCAAALLIGTAAYLQQPFTYLADFKDVAFYGFADSAGNTKTVGLYNLIMQPKDGLCRVQAGRRTASDYDNARYGFCRPSGIQVVPSIYHDAEDFSEGMAAVAKGIKGDFFTTKRWGFIDTKGNEVIYPQYKYVKSFASGLAPVATDERKWQYVDKSGAVKIAGPFYTADVFVNGLAAVAEEYDMGSGVKSFRVGYINASGAWVIKPQTSWIYGHPFYEDRAVIVTTGANSGNILIDRSGKVLSKTYVHISRAASDELYAVKISGTSGLNNLTDVWGLIDKNGKEVTGVTFTGYEPYFSDGLVRFQQDKKWGFKDKGGKVIVPAQFSSASNFSEGLSAVQFDEKGPVGYINKKGAMVIKPQYLGSAHFRDGLAVVSIGKDFSDKEKKTGVIDKTGKTVVPFENHGIGEFKGGKAKASKNYIEYYVYKNGKTSLTTDIETLTSLRYAVQALGRNDIATAVDYLKKLEAKKYPAADYWLGYILLYSQPPVQDIAKGRSLVLSSAAAGYPEAMYLAGLVHGTGAGGTIDYAKALEWFLKAEAAGLPTASKDIAVLYEKGWGMAADPAKAAVYYQKAADSGEASAMYGLGLLYADGRGVTKNANLANKWMLRSGDYGYAAAKDYLTKNAKK